jgi:hypothetical protein
MMIQVLCVAGKSFTSCSFSPCRKIFNPLADKKRQNASFTSTKDRMTDIPILTTIQYLSAILVFLQSFVISSAFSLSLVLRRSGIQDNFPLRTLTFLGTYVFPHYKGNPKTDKAERFCAVVCLFLMLAELHHHVI